MNAIRHTAFTAEGDLKLKSALCAPYRIADYWVVDLPAGVTHVHARPADGRYAEVARVPFDQPLEHPLFEAGPLTIADLPFFRPVG